MAAHEFLQPDWPAPSSVRGAMTTRTGGVSSGRYESFNLAMHVGDELAAVAENRRRLREALRLPSDPQWLEQVHGGEVAVIPGERSRAVDAAVSFTPGAVCAVMVADCLPVFLASREGDRIGLVHAGWRGLAAGVVEAAIAKLECDPKRLVAWLGPSIGPEAFEVGDDVRIALTAGDPGASAHFSAGHAGHFFADLPALTRRRLALAGVTDVHGGRHCTYSEPARFYSHRRDGRTGRMAALLWLA
jgi:purine-nucleoside/S-methyl-5'-thioadenosine phosphorylase / adenosine deaminase